MQYLSCPRSIYAESFRIISEEVDLSQFPEDADRQVVQRMVHACGMPDLVDDIRLTPGVASVIRLALEQKGTVLVDCQMVIAGLSQINLPRDVQVIQTLTDSRIPQIAEELSTTRSAAAVTLWNPFLSGSVIVIGNAPTALFYLLDYLGMTQQRPAAIIGCPVGFVGAAESKKALVKSQLQIPFITVLGRRGGSAIASAALNAVLISIKGKRNADAT